MSMDPDEKQAAISKLINDLRGTTDNMNTRCEDAGLDDMDEEVTARVDAEIFECTVCGWWCESDEEVSEAVGHDEWICKDCAEEQYGTGDIE